MLRAVGRILSTAWGAIVLLRAIIRIRPSICVMASGHALAHSALVLLARVTNARVVVYVPLVDTYQAMGFRAAKCKEWFIRTIYSKVPHAWITITQEQSDWFRAWANIQRPVFALANSVSAEMEAFANQGDAGESLPACQPDIRTRIARVLVLGRLDVHQKGLDLLLANLERRSDLADHFHFSIVGEGPFGEEIKRRLGISKVLSRLVSLYGWGDTPKTMRQHDILLIPSRFEGVPLVMLEAMALGLPVVASDLPGIRAYLPENCLFPVGDIPRAVQVMCELRDVEKRQEVVRHNRQVVLARASGASFSKAVLTLTEGVLEECGCVS
jgi:glycosyltransferase involved in cell wall biosynthesis